MFIYNYCFLLKNFRFYAAEEEVKRVFIAEDLKDTVNLQAEI